MKDSIRESAEKAVAIFATVAAEFRMTGQKTNGLLDKISEHGIELFAAKDGEEFSITFGARPGKPQESSDGET